MRGSESVCQPEEAESYSRISLCFSWHPSRENENKTVGMESRERKNDSSSKEKGEKRELCLPGKRHLQQRELGHRADLGLYSRTGGQ